MNAIMARWVVCCALLSASHAGADYVWSPALKLTAEERYDDDYRLTAGDGSGQLMSKISPKVGLNLKSPSQTGDAFYASDLWMRHGSGRFSWDHRAGIEAESVLSRTLQVEGDARIYRVTDPTSLPRQGLGRSFAPILYGKGTVAGKAQLSGRFSLGTGYTFEGARVYEGDRAPGYVHTPFARAWYRATTRLEVGTEYRYQGFIYGNTFDQSHGAFGALRYRLSRLTTATVRGGPVLFIPQGGVGGGWLPKVGLELNRTGEYFDIGIAAGHDLVGASGLEAALWADYASVTGVRRFGRRFSVFGAASFFRNGQPPGEGIFSNSGRTSQGYAMGGGLQYDFRRNASVQATVDRIAQVGRTEVPGAFDLTRNIAAVRLLLSAW